MGIIAVDKIKAGDEFISKKLHPCGGNEWKLISKGADYKLLCVKCGHCVIVDYNTLIKKFKPLVG